jgi:hypothetical protein
MEATSGRRRYRRQRVHRLPVGDDPIGRAHAKARRDRVFTVGSQISGTVPQARVGTLQQAIMLAGVRAAAAGVGWFRKR